MALDALFNRNPPSLWERFLRSPSLLIAGWAYSFCSTRYILQHEDSRDTSRIRVVCISDTHNAHASLPTLPHGDILIHAGDLTNSGTEQELYSTLDWLSGQPHPRKIWIAGNHDAILTDPTKRDAIISSYKNTIYLEDSSVTSQYTGALAPRHGSGAFQYPRSEADWSHIPPRADIIITHGPPAYHLDAGGSGCRGLLQALWHVRPKLHIFGHIHAGHGTECVGWSDAQMAYERLCAAKGGWLDVLRVTIAAVRALFGGRPRFSDGENTIFVNAAWDLIKGGGGVALNAMIASGLSSRRTIFYTWLASERSLTLQEPSPEFSQIDFSSNRRFSLSCEMTMFSRITPYRWPGRASGVSVWGNVITVNLRLMGQNLRVGPLWRKEHAASLTTAGRCWFP
ncbi:Metallo-dependent phosphatase-like protein [Amylostereum chailletii]|nr:Metallo-dependent phosphatase-like protein [Amylostereum chailletii]